MTRRQYLNVTAVLACLGAGLLAGCATPKGGGAAADPSRSTGPSSAGTSPSRSSASPAASATATRAVAVYYVHTAGPAGVRLYREFHARPRTDTVIRDAVDAMVNTRPADPDYRSLWPAAAQVRRATRAGAVVTVDMAAGPTAPVATAIQQLVWTATAADPTVARVQILVQGRPLTPAPVGRGAPAGVLGPVWLLTPVTGAAVPRTFSFSGEATVFEATVSWELRQGAVVVRSGSATASAGAPGRGAWRASVTAPAAGSYQLVAFESSAKDGSPLFADTKVITVR